ncbi:nSTAND1 domain-containing NTPase [Microlunatus ginsengisoli]|uniref:nSTAND1 domain-containing NTPase n=1 Tax=Microlunatus ginsengisoli TaxID=363863 RepID=UPI0031E2E639
MLAADGGTAGTGFVVTPVEPDGDRLVVTCAHVVAAAGSGPGGTIWLASRGDGGWDGTAQEALVYGDWWREPSREDVAFLRLPRSSLSQAQPLTIGGTSTAAPGQVYETFGFPLVKSVEGLPGRVKVTGRTTEGGAPVLAVRSNEVSRGFSGAPVWDPELGVVVGMIISTIPAGADPAGKQSEVAFVIPAETLIAVCPALGLATTSPYRGLAAFEERHAAYYFGRETASGRLLERLEAHDVVTVVGVSGAGKSSLVRAGLARALEASPGSWLASVPRRIFQPRSAPLHELALALGQLDAVDGSAASSESVAGASSFAPRTEPFSAAALARRLAESFRATGLILIADQFEQLFAAGVDEERQRELVEVLLALAAHGVKVVIALRADFYGHALQHAGLARAVQEAQLILLAMTRAELTETIRLPARRANLALEPGLAETITADLTGQAGDLPLLEFALTLLWEHDSAGRVLTLRSYERIGGLRGALGGHAERVWREFATDAERAAARRVFLALAATEPDDGSAVAPVLYVGRRVRPDVELQGAEVVLEQLIHARLLTAGRDAGSGRGTVELAHESLLRAWPRLQAWVREEHAYLRWFNHDLAPYVRRWVESGESSDFLLPSSLVHEARRWLSDRGDLLTGVMARYINRSVEAREDERRRLERQRDELIAALEQARRQRRLAFARELAAHAEVEAARPNGLERAALLTLESLGAADTAEGRRALDRALSLLPLPRLRIKHHGIVTALAFSRDGRLVASGSQDGAVAVHTVARGHVVLAISHDDRVNSVVFSPDGRTLASASVSGRVLIHSLDDASVRMRIEHFGSTWRVTFSADGRLLATASDDRTARVWDTHSGAELLRINHDGGVNDVTFSPDARLFATASRDGTARLHETATGVEVRRWQGGEWFTLVEFSANGDRLALAGQWDSASVYELAAGVEIARIEHQGWVRAVAFSPDGSLIATGSSDGTARVSELPGGREVMQVRHGKEVWDVAFDPLGRLVATGSEDGIARISVARDGRERTRVEHSSPVRAMAFSPVSALIATGDMEGEVRVCGVDQSASLARIRHAGHVRALRSSADGARIATGSDDGTARVSLVEDGVEVFRTQRAREVYDVDLSSDGRLMAVAGRDGTATVHGIDAGTERLRIEHSDAFRTVRLSRDAQRLASLSFGRLAMVHDLADGRELWRFEHDAALGAIALSPDGTLVAVGTRDDFRSARVFRVGGIGAGRRSLGRDAEVFQNDDYLGPVASLAFSPDGLLLGVASDYGRAGVWELASGDRVLSVDHLRTAMGIAFSRDGRLVAAPGADGTARVLALGTGTEVARVHHDGPVRAVAFSDDTRLLATGSNDGTLRVLDLQTGVELRRTEFDDIVTAICFTPDARRLVLAAGNDVQILALDAALLLDVLRERVSRGLTPAERDRFLSDAPMDEPDAPGH